MRQIQNEQKQPILVEIPETGQFIDIRPLINYFENFKDDSLEKSNQSAIEEIEGTIRRLNTQFIFASEYLAKYQQQVFSNLYELKDLFSSLTFINKSGGQS